MTWTADQCYREGLDFFTDRVQAMDADDWNRPSPCAGWRAVDVLGHIGAATQFGTQLLQGANPGWSPPSGAPGDAVEGDPTAWWDGLVGPARDALEGIDVSKVVDSPVGKRSIGEGLSFPAIDLFVHGWDLARAAGGDVEIPAEAIEFAHRVFDNVPPEMMRSPKVFATAIDIGPEASASDAFLAWTGRDPRGQ
ncbi:MAG: TIGR03086 family metal-binding protein [Acidimicrobiia bacterium]